VSPNALATIAALIAGTAVAVQAAVLGVLGRRTGVLAATTIAAVAGAILILVVALLSVRGGMAAVLRQPPLWWLVPGGLGVAVLGVLAFAQPKIGTFGTFALLIAGQLAASIVIDTVGLFGVDRVPMTVARTIGLGLVLAGAVLVLRR
jgi:transporter family-2 protein